MDIRKAISSIPNPKYSFGEELYFIDNYKQIKISIAKIELLCRFNEDPNMNKFYYKYHTLTTLNLPKLLDERDIYNKKEIEEWLTILNRMKKRDPKSSLNFIPDYHEETTNIPRI